MKTFLARLLAVCAFSALVSHPALAATGWGDDYEKALAQAKAENKMVLLNFTGSDWCGWCIKLKKEVFSQSEFETFAKDNLVLVEVDFPQRRELPKKTQEQNERLQAEFGVRGYPTLIVLNPQGKRVGQLGYQPGGPGPFIARLQEVKGK